MVNEEARPRGGGAEFGPVQSWQVQRDSLKASTYLRT
jgi:hypothetical protein